jgi:recombination protein RecT
MASNQLMEVKKGTVDVVTSKIKELENRGEIQFPPDYSPQNALRSAWLILQETMDRNKKPVLQTCTRTSIMNSLFDMTVQGLNPAKKQVYFIAYGEQLVCQRSYHGTKALAMRADDSIGDIIAEPVWEGDEFEYEIDRGKKRVVKHKQTLDSIDSKKPKGAYCLVLDHQGNVMKTEIMTFEQIKAAWKKSQMRPVQDNGQIKTGSTHAEFMDEMIRKTVINRTCKPIINSSSDANLFRSANRAEQIQAQAEAEVTAEQYANQGEVIDAEVEPPVELDHETGEVLDEQQEKQSEPEPAMAEASADDEPGF